MKNFFLFCCALVGFLLTGLEQAVAQTPAFAWVKQAGGISYSTGRAIVTDAFGNSYVTGAFVGTAYFDSISLTSSGSEDVFIVKYDASGTVLWAVKGGGPGNDKGISIAIDASGNSYVTGAFSGTASFGSTTLTSSGNDDVFTVKYDAFGAVVWAVKGDGPGYDGGMGIAIDGSGNSYVTGFFQSNIIFGTITLTGDGGLDMFTVKYNASGAVMWAVKGSGTSNDSGADIAIDGSGNSYVTGFFSGTATFGGITLTSNGPSDVFAVKYNASGAVIWAMKAGGNGADSGADIALDGSGNSYITGTFVGTANFGGISLTSSSGSDDVFIVKYDASGTVLWAVKGGGPGNDKGLSIAIDASGNSYVTGTFRGTASFGSTTLTSSSLSDAFTAKYNASGAVVWAVKGGGPDYDQGMGIGIDGSGNSYVTGFFVGSATFGATTLTNGGGTSNMFIVKLQSGNPNAIAADRGSPAAAVIYPNPNNGLFSLELKGFRRDKAMLTVFDVTGKQVLGKVVTAVNGTVTEKLQLPEQKGIYLLKVVSDNQVLTRKIIVD
ncbi:SBBP repeat-containing protein [Adhaeribacter soli]|uniref:T9SS type A sorting domain-containing protein n=1 Tax=Adhaeribacter soli TaxID=2607655 RepID=A0A5N1IVF8_9BACT|nr:SBBP repeat-containing protein [Adhaeribacter soli]KAA9331919.1 T9SS type A sorting domain-containing protein [Adhaeribacter soli]